MYSPQCGAPTSWHALKSVSPHTCRTCNRRPAKAIQSQVHKVNDLLEGKRPPYWASSRNSSFSWLLRVLQSLLPWIAIWCLHLFRVCLLLSLVQCSSPKHNTVMSSFLSFLFCFCLSAKVTVNNSDLGRHRHRQKQTNKKRPKTKSIYHTTPQKQFAYLSTAVLKKISVYETA